MDIVKPVFVYGIGRSGTTIFHRVLAEHEEAAWLSGLCGKYPDKPSRNRMLMTGIDLPVIGGSLKKRFRPWENYDFWEHYCRGFSAPCRDLTADDVTAVAKAGIRKALAETLTRRRHRLVAKITGWPRIGYLREVFNDAKFVHIVRDGRAVVNSRLNVDFWKGYGGVEKWSRGELSPHLREEWERCHRSFVALGAIEWKLLLRANEEATRSLDGSQYIEIKYEDFCADSAGVMKKVASFCELPWSAGFERAVRNARIRNENDKWERDLTARQQKDLHSILQEHLIKYGYLES